MTSGRFAEREIRGFDDQGAEERIVVWIQRREGALWAVGRAVNPQHRESDEPRADDYVFEGHELEDALEKANEVLEDDLRVSEDDGRPQRVMPFTRKELLGPLERWFFGRRGSEFVAQGVNPLKRIHTARRPLKGGRFAAAAQRHLSRRAGERRSRLRA